MVPPAVLWQKNFNRYRKCALEHGYTDEEIDSVEKRIKWLYRHERLSLLPRQLDLIWAAHQLLNIEREMKGLV